MGVEQLSSVIDDYISARQEAKPEKWSSKGEWLDDAAKRAKQITLVTHAPKFTHGDARGIGARVEGMTGEEYLSTASLTAPVIDVDRQCGSPRCGQSVAARSGRQTAGGSDSGWRFLCPCNLQQQ